jgi:CAAX protease family protein
VISRSPTLWRNIKVAGHVNSTMSDPSTDIGVILSPEPNTPLPSASHTVFRGPNGIRAGWRILIFLALVAAVALAITIPFAILSILKGAGRSRTAFQASGLTPLGLSITEGSIFLCTAIAALIMTRTEHRKFGVYGLPLRSAFRKDFWIGTLIGFAAISASLLAIFSFHGFRLTGLAIHGRTILSAMAAWGATFILVGLAEEFAFRGYLQFTLTSGIGFWPSAILLSALFGLAHAGNPGESKAGLFSVVLFGLLFCLFLRRTGNLWWAVGFHAGWDWGQTFFYGVADSGIAPYHNLLNSAFTGPRWLTGGTVGPEASLFTPVVLVLVAVLFTRFYTLEPFGLRHQRQAT